MQPKYQYVPRSTYQNYEGSLTGNVTLDVIGDLGRSAIDGSIKNTDSTNAFTFKMNATGSDAITVSAGETFSLEGMYVDTIYLIKGASNSAYKVFVN